MFFSLEILRKYYLDSVGWDVPGAWELPCWRFLTFERPFTRLFFPLSGVIGLDWFSRPRSEWLASWKLSLLIPPPSIGESDFLR